ncbi:MAG: GMC oxidoreductase, partial [Planctomycetota bacterium]
MASITFLKRERGFFKVVLAALLASVESATDHVAEWLRPLFKGRPFPELDPNHWSVQRRSQEGLCQIPLAVRPDGRRSGPRERLLTVHQMHPDRLHLCTGLLVTRLCYSDAVAPAGDVASPDATRPMPTVCGVEVLMQEHAYQADPLYEHIDHTDDAERTLYCQREVILCGGAFNTPQLLMLSGIGPADHLQQPSLDIQVRVDSPGVGGNLQDRYEVPVTATLKDRFRTLDDLGLSSKRSQSVEDTVLKQWIDGVGDPLQNDYSTNGGLIGYFKRSAQEPTHPDLFLFASAAYFPGYHLGWSSPARLSPTLPSDADGTTRRETDAIDETPTPRSDTASKHKRSLTWLVLKARTRNRDGTVRLRNADPRRRPEIHFRSFEHQSDPNQSGHEPDLEAIHEGVEVVKSILDYGQRKGVIQNYEMPGLGRFDGDQRRWIRNVAWGHQASGTCKMGRASDRTAVVDSRLRLHGARNLRIVDASVFPKIPGYFLVTSIYMVAEKAADLLSEDHPLPGASDQR